MIATCLAVHRLGGTPLKPLNEVVNQRGPASFLILWMGFSIAGATLQALRHRETRQRLAQFLLFASGLPLLIGGIATYIGLENGRKACAALAASAPSATQAEQLSAIFTRIAWDPAKLAAVVAIICVTLSLHLWMRIENRNKS